MNNYTEIGNYYASTNTVVESLSNAPFTNAFILKVIYSNGIQYPCQIYREYNTGRIAARLLKNVSGSENEWYDYIYFSDDATVLANAQQVILPEHQSTSEADTDNYLDNYSSSFAGNTHYFGAINLATGHSDIGGGHFLLEGYKTTTDYEWQQMTSYDSRLGFSRKIRSKYNGVWGEWVPG